MTHFEPQRDLDLSKNTLPPVPVVYHSRSEAGVAAVFERWVPGWKPTMNDTVQIELGGGRTVDFRVGKILIEYHPVLFSREMRSEKAKELYYGLREQLNETQRYALAHLLQDELIEQYAHRRWQLVSCSKYRDHGLIVVQSVDELHSRVLPKILKQVPSLYDVKTVFLSAQWKAGKV